MTNGTVLIVDDNEAVRRLLVAMLESEGYAALHADSARHAMQIASAHRIDAFLVDIDMPGTSGIALSRIIREAPDYKLTPILFVTGTTGNLAAAFAAGGGDLINKPIDPLVLQARLKMQLQRAEDAQQLSRTRSMLNHYLSSTHARSCGRRGTNRRPALARTARSGHSIYRHSWLYGPVRRNGTPAALQTRKRRACDASASGPRARWLCRQVRWRRIDGRL